jgi:hypothetical protein
VDDAATSSTLIATTSQPRSLLSIAKLNMARSRAFGWLRTLAIPA